MEQNLKKLFEEYNSLPNCPQRARLARDIRVIKNRIVRDMDYVYALYLLQFMGKKAKNRFFIDLLDRSRDTTLFVLAFADSDMYAYKRAYETEVRDGDDDALRHDVQVFFDSKLCAFLAKYKSDEDLDYVLRLTDGTDF